MQENGYLKKGGCTKVVLIQKRLGKVNFGCWNCAGVYGNFIYIKALLCTLDVLALSEHWLYEDELIFLNSLDDSFDVIHAVVQKIISSSGGKEGKVELRYFLRKR